MATTHVFVVGFNTFKYHLEYLFVGTGAKEMVIDFNNSITSNLHHSHENALLGMIADSQRVRTGDLVIFYLQQDYNQGIYEGKFYGVFKVLESPSFLDNNDGNQFLKASLNKSLTFRTLIEPYQVYAKGITEWEALDQITNIESPLEMQWSLIYRKLKGNRGNTMITIKESENLIKLIQERNRGNLLNNESLTFNIETQEIEASDLDFVFSGRQEIINILPRLIQKYCSGNQFETHLQAYLLQNIENLPMFTNQDIEWVGNEVSCGVGMQRIDIMLSINGANRKVVPIELKSVCAYINITSQLQRYIDWIEQYYVITRESIIEPMIIARKITDKTSEDYLNLINAFNSFNETNETLKLRYVEFSIDCEDRTIGFNEIDY